MRVGKRGTDFFPCYPPLSDERDPPSTLVPQPTCSTSIYRVASLGLPPYLPSLFLFFSHPHDLSSLLAPSCRSLLCHGTFLFRLGREEFSRRNRSSSRGGKRVSGFDRELRGIRADPKICSPLARRRPEVVQLESCTV